MSETMELAVVNAQNAVQIFTGGGLTGILDGIEAKVRAIPLDGSTPAGRNEIRSTAYKVARTKTALDAEAKKLTEGWRTSTAQVNAERKRAQERLDALADEVRAPLTAFENKEKNRMAAHENAIRALESFRVAGDRQADEWEAIKAEFDGLHVGRDWEEFQCRAKKVREETGAYLIERITARRKFDADQAELARLRKEAAETAQRQRDERLKAEAAEAARLEAERRAKEERDAEARRVIEAANAEQARVNAEAARVKAEHEREQREAEAARRKEEEARKAASEALARALANGEKAAREAEAARARLEAKAAQDLKDAQEKAARDAKAAADAAVIRERERAEKARKAREQSRPIEILAALKAVVDGYDYNPGDSDLDNEQPISVRMTLGDYRRAARLKHELEGK